MNEESMNRIFRTAREVNREKTPEEMEEIRKSLNRSPARIKPTIAINNYLRSKQKIQSKKGFGITIKIGWWK
ncbi:MAG: hypothetical protein ACQEUT_18280 [Bacillota bacterium]